VTAASGYPGNVALCMHCGLSIVRKAAWTASPSGGLSAGPVAAWQDAHQSVTCQGGELAHVPFPAGHGLRGEAR
jgi:hypothetical protein